MKISPPLTALAAVFTVPLAAVLFVFAAAVLIIVWPFAPFFAYFDAKRRKKLAETIAERSKQLEHTT